MKLMKCMNLSAVAGVMVLGLAVVAHSESFPTHHVFDVVAKGQVKLLGPVPSDQVIQLDVMLPVKDKAALDAAVAQMYNKSSSTYKKYLTPAQFSAQYGPSQSDYTTAVNYLQSHGLTVVGGTLAAMDIQVKGPVSAIESAFNVKMNNYEDPVAGREFYSPDREPTTTLSVPLWHVSGLDNYSVPKPLYSSRSAIAKEKGITPAEVSPLALSGSGPETSYLGSDMRKAYMPTLQASYGGQGQYVGLFEFVGTNLDDLNTYYRNAHQTNDVPITLYSADGYKTSCVYARYDHWCDDTEQTLDMTQALGMAPSLDGLIMFVGQSDSAIISAMTTYSPLPSAIGCSWGWYPVDPTTLDPLFERMALQGQTFLVAAGDSGNWADSYFVWPADDAYVTTVGGSDLYTNGPGGSWKSESAWEYGGGGIAVDGTAIPTWQSDWGIYVVNSENGASSTLRNGPDVAANANFTFYVCADMLPCTANDYGGTSFAAPMWAGLVADFNVWTNDEEEPNAGFLNPAIYGYNSIALDDDLNWYSLAFNDITTGAQYNGFPAVAGYDLVTGWGSPKVDLFYYFAGFCDVFECEI